MEKEIKMHKKNNCNCCHLEPATVLLDYTGEMLCEDCHKHAIKTLKRLLNKTDNEVKE
jgi:hypothetical protein